MDADTLKQVLGSPLGLLVVMVGGALGSAFKQMAIARRESGLKIDAWGYLTNYWPETLITVGGVLAAFATMLMTDTLNFASAILGGYTANSAADLLTRDGRSSGMRNQQSGFIRPLVLGLLLAIGAVGVVALPGCQTLEQAKPTTTQERLVAANEGVNAVAIAATSSLQSGAISVKQAEAVSASGREAQKWLTLAEEAFAAGDAATGEANLVVAETLLRSLRALLAGGDA